MKLYVVRYSVHNASYEWHLGDVYSDVAIFVNEDDANALCSKILNIKHPWKELEPKYDAYVSEIEEGKIKDNLLLQELDDKKADK